MGVAVGSRRGGGDRRGVDGDVMMIGTGCVSRRRWFDVPLSKTAVQGWFIYSTTIESVCHHQSTRKSYTCTIRVQCNLKIM